MSNLKQFLLEAKEAYYKGKPLIADSQYDALEEKCGEILDVGYNLDDGIPHFSRLYSLAKKYKDEDALPEDLNNWIKTPKLDGASVALLYIDGKFTQALTRGDGKKGKDVTLNMSQIVPLEIKSNNLVLQIRGELVAPKTIENARNYAAGALGLKDHVEFRQRDVVFIAHEVYPCITHCYTGDMAAIEPYFRIVMHNYCDKYPQDGEVYRLNDNRLYESMGFTSKHPRGAFALKVRSEGIPTTLLDVIWQTGKSGKVTPVAILDPIVIEDALVSRATLNNVGFIESLGLEIGDTVLVERAGGIIPRIICKAE